MAQRLAFPFWFGDGDGGIAPAVQPGVVDQVGHHAGEAAAVAADDHSLGAFGDGDGSVRRTAHGDGLADELGDQQVVEVQPDRAGVEP